MESKTYFGEYSLKHWINLMLRRNIILPSYQRSFVWGVQDLERLILSFRSGQFIQPVTIARINSVGNGANIILDGQQRLTSILLFVLGCFPKKEKFQQQSGYSSEDDSAVTEEDDVVESAILDWTFEKLLNKDVSKNTISDIKHSVSNPEFYEKLSLKPECTMSDKDLNTFLENTFLGFSYIVPINAGAEAEQTFFSTLFRNMNYLGKRLSVLESRKSLYFLNEKYKNYFEGKLKDNSDVLCGLRIMENVAPASIDFVRYLSILSQYDGKNVRKVMVGYSSYSSRESYYVDYVSHILNLEQESRIDKFDKFKFDTAFEPEGWEGRFEKLHDTISNLKNKMNLDKKHQNAFSSWIDADYWLFGLIYWIVFQGKEVDVTTDWSREIGIKIASARNSYNRTPNLLGNIRSRLEESVKIIRKHVVK